MPAYINKQGYIRVSIPGFDGTLTSWRGQPVRPLPLEEKEELVRFFNMAILSGNPEAVKMWFPRERAKFLVKNISEPWLYHKAKRPCTLAIQSQHLKSWILPMVGNKDVRELTRQDFYWIRERWGDSAMGKAVRKNAQALINWAWREGMTDKPIYLPSISIPRKPTPYIELADRWRIHKALPEGPYQDMLIISIEMGLRRAEIVALKWDCVDFDRDVLKIIRTLSANEIVEMRKGGDEYWAPLTDRVKNMLLDRRKHRKSHWLFHGPEGNHLWADAFSKEFKVAARACGLPQATLHHCRHSLVIDLLSEGKSIEYVAALIGDNITTVQKHYAGLGIRHLRRVAKVFKKGESNHV